jgi:valyl-tRNA synthetase
VGRISSILQENKVNKNTIEILALNEKISLKFNEDIDLASQKQSILQKLANLEKQTNGLKNKLDNKAYIKNAPKEIVQNDKKLLKELTVEDDKLRSIVSSIN